MGLSWGVGMSRGVGMSWGVGMSRGEVFHEMGIIMEWRMIWGGAWEGM